MVLNIFLSGGMMFGLKKKLRILNAEERVGAAEMAKVFWIAWGKRQLENSQTGFVDKSNDPTPFKKSYFTDIEFKERFGDCDDTHAVSISFYYKKIKFRHGRIFRDKKYVYDNILKIKKMLYDDATQKVLLMEKVKKCTYFSIMESGIIKKLTVIS